MVTDGKKEYVFIIKELFSLFVSLKFYFSFIVKKKKKK